MKDETLWHRVARIALTIVGCAIIGTGIGFGVRSGVNAHKIALHNAERLDAFEGVLRNIRFELDTHLMREAAAGLHSIGTGKPRVK